MTEILTHSQISANSLQSKTAKARSGNWISNNDQG